MIKKIVALIIIFLGLYYIYDNNLFDSKQLVRDVKKEVYLPSSNQYIKTNVTNSFVKMTNDFSPKNKQDLLNIYYTIVNSGWDKFVFYCGYDDCIRDVNSLSTDSILLSHINSFVSPYNQYNSISTYTTPLLNSKVTITVIKTYDSLMINEINKKINELYNDFNLNDLSDQEKIMIIHDYIVEHTKYDALKIDNINDTTYHSNTAYGLLFEGYAVCSGYADMMAIFLDKMDIPNMKVTSETHVWNLVYIENKWQHLDLTWDDPYSAEGENLSNHSFFLINYQQLKEWNAPEHIFDQNIYQEALNSL